MDTSKAQPIKNKRNSSEKAFSQFQNAWQYTDQAKRDAIFALVDDYKCALDNGKTEREFVDYSIRQVEQNGFVHLGGKAMLRTGDRVYADVRGKGLVCAIIGSDDPLNGFNIIGAHVDSPRLDLKPNPIYETNDLVLLKTHYYGGLRNTTGLARN